MCVFMTLMGDTIGRSEIIYICAVRASVARGLQYRLTGSSYKQIAQVHITSRRCL
jgi:hypothetical protein